MVAYYRTNTGEKKFGSSKRVLLVTKGSHVAGTLVVYCISVFHISRRFAVMVAPFRCE